MKVIILAGGLGSRISEYTKSIPKPMILINKIPILIHIMKHFSKFEFNEFIIATGYKGNIIKNYFKKNTFKNWKIEVVDTGKRTMTGGRLKKVKGFLDPNEPFLFTYGDGVGEVKIDSLIKFHESHGKLATVTAVNPPGRFGILDINEADEVVNFNEKPQHGTTWINGGFFILNPKVIDYIEHDQISWEEEPIRAITNKNELAAFRHSGFWQPMDTLAEKKYLEGLYDSDGAPWKVWE